MQKNSRGGNIMYDKLKEQAIKDIVAGKKPVPSLVNDFAKQWSDLVGNYINKMNVIEARVACKVVLQSLGLNPNIIDPDGDDKDRTWQPKMPGKY